MKKFIITGEVGNTFQDLIKVLMTFTVYAPDARMAKKAVRNKIENENKIIINMNVKEVVE